MSHPYVRSSRRVIACWSEGSRAREPSGTATGERRSADRVKKSNQEFEGGFQEQMMEITSTCPFEGLISGKAHIHLSKIL
eukprot:753915-Hanusia_phi.AAC.3